MFYMVDRWLQAYLGLLVLFYVLASWCAVKILKVVVFVFVVCFSILVYAISMAFGKLLKGRVVPIFARRG